MKIEYTKSALLELEEFQIQKKKELEEFLKNKKYVFGDEVIEITASDIKEASRNFKVSELSGRKLPLTNMLLKLYMFIGVAMVVGGLFYQDIRQMIGRNPEQLSIVVAGLSLTLVSFFGSYYMKIKAERRFEIEKRYIELESKVDSEYRKETTNKQSKSDA
jgi:hypothetical protein